jgi:Fe-S oxidoreductase
MHIDEHSKTIFEWKFSPMANYICPTYKVTKNESNSPRGLAFLLSLITGDQRRPFDEVTAERMYQCASCWLCTSLGYDETDPAAAFIAARADIVEKNLVPTPVLAYKEKLGKKSGLRGLPKPARSGDVAVVIDPLIYAQFPEELKADLALLDSAGFGYEIVGAERPSGAQLFELGYFSEAREMAQALNDELKKYRTRVFLSPYDYWFLTSGCRQLGLAGSDGDESIPYPAFLLTLVKKGKLRFSGSGPKKKCCYLDAAHFVRPESVFLGVEDLLRPTGRVEYKPLWRGGRLAPSDAGDFLPFVYPELAAGINARLLAELSETGADTVLVSCPYTLLNLRSAAASASMAVEDLGSFLLGCLGK